MYAFLLSTAVIFVAELGDKSQLMAMTFADPLPRPRRPHRHHRRHRLVHLVSVGIGCCVGDAFADSQDSSRSSPASPSSASPPGRCAATS